jgi:hypothetical protein
MKEKAMKATTQQIMLINACCLLALCGSPSAFGQSLPVGKPAALRGVELGISLEQFRQLPVVSDGGETNLRTSCTNDAGVRSYAFDDVNSADVADGIVSCQWFGKRNYLDSSLFIDLGAGKVLPVFDFIDVSGIKRLFRIHSYANSEYYAAVSDALKRGYGAPKVSTAPFQTLGGASFTSTTSVWSNGVSSITLTEPCRRLQRYCLTYQHAEYSKLYDNVVEKRAAAAATKL